jgi:tetratricopeptide (TPR) repeat protein
MRLTAKIAALHGAYWSFDRWYRMWWYIWPGAAALLVCGWIYVDKPARSTTASPAAWGKPLAATAATPMRRSPVLADWPEKLHNDVMACFSNAIDLNPLIDACTRLIDSGQANTRQMVAAYSQRGYDRRLTQPDVALADYNAALTIQADSPAVLTNRAFIYLTRSEYDAALEDLNKAIGLFAPGYAGHARYYRGFTLLKLKRYPEAITDLNEAVKLEPRNPDPYLARGETEQVQARYDDALRDFDEYSKLAPRDARGLIGRGLVLEATGRKKEALAALESAATLDSVNPRVLAIRDRLRSQQYFGDDATR